MAAAVKEESAESNPYLDTSLIASLQHECLYDNEHKQHAQPMPNSASHHDTKGGLEEHSMSSTSYNINNSNNGSIKSGYLDIDNEPITLDIGGKIFRTSLSTLKKYPSTIFSKMFSGSYSMKPNENGSYFIDRDGEYFRYILNYLRSGKLIIPAHNKQLIAELLEECKFYQIAPLINILSIKQINTKILRERHIAKLNNFIIDRVLSNSDSNLNADKKRAYSWKLLYRFEANEHAGSHHMNQYTKFSRNTLESSYIVLKDFVFLSKISGYSPTLIVISADKYILGGFTTIEWPSHCSQWKKKTILSNDSTHSTWDFLEFWSPRHEQCKHLYRHTFIFKFVDDDNCSSKNNGRPNGNATEDNEESKSAETVNEQQSDDDKKTENVNGFFEYKMAESKDNEFGHPELHGTVKTHREDWNQSPLPYFRTHKAASDCFDKSKPHINDSSHLYLYHLDGSIAVHNPWTKQQSYVRTWECFQLQGYKY